MWPLLHTWSLGVEEQFYLVFPMLLYLFYVKFFHVKFGARTLSAVVIVFLVASLVANVVLAPSLNKFAFYMLQTRAWELLLGVALGLKIVPRIESCLAANVASMSGGMLIVGSMVFLDRSSIFPGVNAIYPALGAALIIHAGTTTATWVSMALRQPPLVYIGKISYSLYLWHWPVAIYISMLYMGLAGKVAVIVLAFFLSVLSYHFLEQRYRRKNNPLESGRVFLELAILGLFVVMISITIILGQGFDSRIPVGAFAAVDKTSTMVDIPKSVCTGFVRTAGGENGTLCRLGSQEGEAQFIVWGDSHAKAISPALHKAALGAGVTGYSLAIGGCRPLLGSFRKNKTKCLEFNNEVAKFVKENPAIDTIFLVGYWRIPLMSQGYDNSGFFIRDEETRFGSVSQNKEVFRRGLDRLVAEFKDKKVVLVEDIPEIGSQFGKSVNNHFIRSNWLGLQRSFVFHEREDEYDKELADVVSERSSAIGFLRIKHLLCSNGDCPLLIDGRLVYHDGDHLSESGAILLAPVFDSYMQRLVNPK